MNREGAKVTSAGRAFQTRAPVTEKAQRPTVGSLTAGTHRSSMVEDRSLCRDGMSALSSVLHKKQSIYIVYLHSNDHRQMFAS